VDAYRASNSRVRGALWKVLYVQDVFGIKPKLMKCRFELTYFYDLLTYLATIRAKVVMFGIKPKLMKCRFELTYFLITY
jgi:hypothetical protein